jgi:hypothetical protein
MAYDRHETIRLRAYEIWENEGCPNGQDLRHWQQAEQEILSLEFSFEQAGAFPLVVRLPKPATPAAA